MCKRALKRECKKEGGKKARFYGQSEADIRAWGPSNKIGNNGQSVRVPFCWRERLVLLPCIIQNDTSTAIT
jgi:hypothetical protein